MGFVGSKRPRLVRGCFTSFLRLLMNISSFFFFFLKKTIFLFFIWFSGWCQVIQLLLF